MKKLLILTLYTSFMHSTLLSSSSEEIKHDTMQQTQSLANTSALRIASKKGDTTLMQKFIQLGADVNDVMGRDWPHAGRTLLVDAIDSGSYEAVKLLLDAGADSEIQSEVLTDLNILNPRIRNFASLSYAIMVNAPIEIIELLIHYSKNVNISTDYYNWTPYKIAAFYKNYQAMAALSRAGAVTGGI